MFVLGFSLGLIFGVGFWVWQQYQLNRYLAQMLQPLTTRSPLSVSLPLIPRLRDEIALVKYQGQFLQQQLRTYQDLLEFAPIGYLQVDDENQLLWCNEQARVMLYLERWQPGQVRLLLELVRSYELDRLIELTRDRAAQQIKEWEFHPSCESPQAVIDVKPIILRATSLPLSQGQVGVFLENRQPLQNAILMRDRSFSDLAHELRTPLTSIRLVVETLQDRLDSPLKSWVDRLMLEVDRLINLVQSWLDLTQLENNPKLQLQRQPVDIKSLIYSAWETLEPLAQRQQIDFSYSAPENIWIQADPSRMYEVFVNLLDNCIKYSNSHNKIQVEVRIIPAKLSASKIPENSREQMSKYTSFGESKLEINVIDSGVGFSETDLPHVFERFYRGDTARTRKPAEENSLNTTVVGTGLGLAIVQQIVLAHGGSIKAMNHPKTKGAWMQIELPEVMANYRSQDYI
ncbi:HAMP domain-containing sensor histidine kinase [Calothrix sp. UHCC 0171]|uniref:sensor histidine kinase n=1 Tax=Calothrix sp. UHCC 0171 TaxID=3110245 RepID=UPI002B207533|nr:HAMP domain-containing sensor histidine kinase [Calothrix sp. UHCC 0171]MEA5574254.1 HAMP domain-containing sensor histidine kinase [Calothrix sp. UHCC 0171]